MACTRRLIVYMVDAQAFQSHMEVIYALVHACRLVSTDAYVQKMICVVDGLRIHLRVATVVRATARTAEATDPSEHVRMVKADCI
jgi:hypothetical protein